VFIKAGAYCKKGGARNKNEYLGVLLWKTKR